MAHKSAVQLHRAQYAHAQAKCRSGLTWIRCTLLMPVAPVTKATRLRVVWPFRSESCRPSSDGGQASSGLPSDSSFLAGMAEEALVCGG